jgi:hypothetical protein
MLFFLFLSCHIGRPTFEVSVPEIRWQEDAVVSRQWEIQLERAIMKNIATESVQQKQDKSIVSITSLNERLVVDDPMVGQVWSVTITVQLDDGFTFQEEERYIVHLEDIGSADSERLSCYERLIDNVAYRVIIFYKYGKDYE